MDTMPKLPEGRRWAITFADKITVHSLFISVHVTFLCVTSWVVDEGYPKIEVSVDYHSTEEEIKKALSEEAHRVMGDYNMKRELEAKLNGWANG